MHLDSCAVELVLERRGTELVQGVGHAVRRLGEHRLQRPEKLEGEPRQPAPALPQSRLCDRRRTARQHHGAAHVRC